MALSCRDTNSKDSVQRFSLQDFLGGQNGLKSSKMPNLTHFDPLRKGGIWHTREKCFEFVSQHVRAIPETHSEKEMQLQLSPNARFSSFSTFPIHFHWISIVKFEWAVGGSNDLQSSPIFFWQLFITFVHRIKKHNPKLKKSGNLKHPTVSSAFCGFYKNFFLVHQLLCFYKVFVQLSAGIFRVRLSFRRRQTLGLC